jgi:hypothetical protein
MGAGPVLRAATCTRLSGHAGFLLNERPDGKKIWPAGMIWASVDPEDWSTLASAMACACRACNRQQCRPGTTSWCP